MNICVSTTRVTLESVVVECEVTGVSTSLDSSLPSLIERMLCVSQPRLGSDHHGDLQLVRTLPLGKHRLQVVCHLKHQMQEQTYFFGRNNELVLTELSSHILFYLLLDHGRVHVGNLSDGEFGRNLSRDHSLCAGVREGPLNAVDRDSGVAPHVGQQVHLQETCDDASKQI